MAKRNVFAPKDTSITYEPSPTPRLFHASDQPVRGIVGPIGSGKSVACAMEMFMRMKEQEPYQGVRMSRWAIIRNTYPELISTSMNTWRDWVPESICRITFGVPITAHVSFPMDDGTTVESEVYFLALDKDDDIKKLKSLELTGAWINEASEVPKAVLDMSLGRIDRFPSKRMGGATWSGVIMDTNPPDDDSWWYDLAEIKKPKGYRFFKQPPAVLLVPKSEPPEYCPNMGQGPYPAAENVSNHTSGFEYYMRQVHGKDFEWIKVFLMGQYGTLISGKPVYPEYDDTVHCAKADLEVYRGIPLILGWDFGLMPAVAICQLSPRGQFRVIDEICTEDCGIRRMARDYAKPLLMNAYHGMTIISVGDPAGNSKSQTTEITCLQELSEAGIQTKMARTNELVARREAVAGFLTRTADGSPGFQLSPKCKVIRKGFLGGYHYEKIRVSGTERFRSVPTKNKWSHPHDGLQYAAMEAENTPINYAMTGTGNAAGMPIRRSRGQHRDVVVVSGGCWT